MELAVGTVINRTYELLEVLGQGGMGQVWRAGHLRLPKYVAIKVLTATSIDDDDIVARFRREAEVTTRLGHPNIVEVLDFDTLPDGRAYIVMELLEGQNLRQRLAAGRLSLEEAIDILKQVASALYVAHQAGVVHRDLKPENIFLTRGISGLTAKILDFGISKVQGSQSVVTRKSTVLGTPGYMSPEQARGEHKLIDARTDQFALATIGYEMFSGQCAYSGETLAEVVFKVVFQQATPLRELIPELPDNVFRAIERAMAKDPAERFADVVSFIQSLSGTTLKIPTVKDLPAPAMLSGPSDPALAATQISRSSQPPLPQTQQQHQQQQEVASAETIASAAVDPIPPTLARMVQTQVGHKSTKASPDPGDAEPVAPTPSKKLPWVILAALIGVTGVAAAALYSRDSRDAPKPPARPAEATKRADAGSAKQPVAVRDATVTKDAPPQVAARDAAVKAPDLQQAREAKGDTRRPITKRRSSGGAAAAKPATLLPPEVAEDLKLARQALERGAYSETLRLANKSLRTRKTTAGLVLRAKAYCGNRDLANVRGALRAVPRRNRRLVKKYCRKIGMSID